MITQIEDDRKFVADVLAEMDAILHGTIAITLASPESPESPEKFSLCQLRSLVALAWAVKDDAEAQC
jgi:hypothetical protein